jgi:2-polyprenyl-3-methyl-5-hydroxy-6-metoxy-1,4-benzoquinol methylase
LRAWQAASVVHTVDPLDRFYGTQVFGAEIKSPATNVAQEAQARRLIEPSQHDPVLVDIGCGGGAGTARLAHAIGATRVIGIDLSQPSLTDATIQQRYHGVRASGLSLPLPASSVDVVMLNDVIEHVVDPDELLDEIGRVLRPGGHLLLSTPNLAAWFNRAALAVGTQPAFSEVSLRAIHGRPGAEVVGHLRLFTLKALRSLLDARGFDVTDVAGAPYHDTPRPFRPLDRLIARIRPAMSAILVVASVRRP